MAHNSPRTPPPDVATDELWLPWRTHEAVSPAGFAIDETSGVAVPVLSKPMNATSRLPAVEPDAPVTTFRLVADDVVAA
jgi:hypothetical protein